MKTAKSRRVENILFTGTALISIMLVFVVTYSYRRQYDIIIENYLVMESEIILEAKEMADLWFNKRMKDGNADIDTIEQEILANIIEPIHLLENGDAWIYNKDYVIFDKSSDFPDYYRGKSMRQIFDMQKEHGASHYEEMTAGVENATEGQGWYIWLPEKGKEWVAWTSFSFHEKTWTLGLSTPEKEILENANIYSFLVRQIIYYSILILLIFSIAILFLNFHKKQEKLIIELEELNAKKDKFFSIIAHDLRNPISSIIGISNLLVEKTEKEASEDLYKTSELLQQSSTRVMDLLSNLLEWSRNEIGSTEIKPQKFDINNTIIETIELLKLPSVKKDIKLNFDNLKPNPVFTDQFMVKNYSA